MLVTCQRFGDLFLFGLIWQYSSNHKTYNVIVELTMQFIYHGPQTFFNIPPDPQISISHNTTQKYSRLRCLLRVKGLVICFYLGWSGSILQFRQNIIKVGSKSWLLTCSSNITLSLPSYTGSALKRELNFCNGYLSLLYLIKSYIIGFGTHFFYNGGIFLL